MQRRQSWFRDEVLDQGVEPLEFVGKYINESDVEKVASAIRSVIKLDFDWAAVESTADTAFRTLRDLVDEAGILVVVNGVVGNDTSRELRTDEFRGFALVDQIAPLIFINNENYKPSQIFTLVHELAHLFVGESGVSNSDPEGNSKSN